MTIDFVGSFNIRCRRAVGVHLAAHSIAKANAECSYLRDQIKWNLEYARDFLQSCSCSLPSSALQVGNVALSDVSLLGNIELGFPRQSRSMRGVGVTQCACHGGKRAAITHDHDSRVEIAFWEGDLSHNIHQRLYASSVELTFYRVLPPFALADAERSTHFTSDGLSSLLTFDRLFNRKFKSKEKDGAPRGASGVQLSCGLEPDM